MATHDQEQQCSTAETPRRTTLRDTVAMNGRKCRTPTVPFTVHGLHVTTRPDSAIFGCSIRTVAPYQWTPSVNEELARKEVAKQFGDATIVASQST